MKLFRILVKSDKMAYIDTIFNTSGKIPTNANFWEQSIDSFVTSDGITNGFGKVIGEQMFKPLKSPFTPFYQRFAGAPISAGVGWTERALKATTMRAFKPKATADDALSFYDSAGIEKTFTQNVAGWSPCTVPSDFVSPEMFVSRNGVGQLNSLIVDNNIMTYQRAIESEIEKKAISCTKNDMEVDLTTDDIVTVMGQIMDRASEMLSDDYHYNELTDDENADIVTRSDKVYLFMNQKYINAYKNAKANLPSPSELVNNVEVVPMVNALPAPITTEEWNAGYAPSGETVKAWDSKPVAIDDPAPIAYMVANDKIVYRPVEGSYKVNMQSNAAGDFVNTHLIYKGAIAVRPWENAVRVNLKA